MRHVVVIAALIVAIGALTYGIYYGIFLPMHNAGADARGHREARDKTNGDGDYRLAEHQFFYQTCASVQSKEDSITQLVAERDDKDAPPSAQRRTTIAASLTALRNSRSELVRDYNSKSDDTATSGQFRADNLPIHLNARIPSGGTQCSYATARPSSGQNP